MLTVLQIGLLVCCCVEEKVLTGGIYVVLQCIEIFLEKDHQITSSHHSPNLPQDIDGGEVQLDCGPEHLLDLAEVPNDANGVSGWDTYDFQKPFKGGNVGFLHVNVYFFMFVYAIFV